MITLGFANILHKGSMLILYPIFLTKTIKIYNCANCLIKVKGNLVKLSILNMNVRD
jgi:hypothetical protein